jgi:hypothetical protein
VMSFLPYSNLAGERCLTYIGTEGRVKTIAGFPPLDKDR